MNVGEIKDEVMFQTNNDVDDLSDFMPYLTDYVNDGYDRLVYAWCKQHVGSTDWPKLSSNSDTPNLPAWTHRALADWATWLVYRNGNPQKQNRGLAFRSAFEDILGKLLSEGGVNGSVSQFINIPW